MIKLIICLFIFFAGIYIGAKYSDQILSVIPSVKNQQQKTSKLDLSMGNM
jgi:hypothetical protein